MFSHLFLKAKQNYEVWDRWLGRVSGRVTKSTFTCINNYSLTYMLINEPSGIPLVHVTIKHRPIQDLLGWLSGKQDTRSCVDLCGGQLILPSSSTAPHIFFLQAHSCTYSPTHHPEGCCALFSQWSTKYSGRRRLWWRCCGG